MEMYRHYKYVLITCIDFFEIGFTNFGLKSNCFKITARKKKV